MFTVKGQTGTYAEYRDAEYAAETTSLIWGEAVMILHRGEPFAVVNAISGRKIIGLGGLTIYDHDGNLKSYYAA